MRFHASRTVLVVTLWTLTGCAGGEDESVAMSFDRVNAVSSPSGDRILTTLTDPQSGAVVLTVNWDSRTGTGTATGDNLTVTMTQDQEAGITVEDANSRAYAVWDSLQYGEIPYETTTTCKKSYYGACNSCWHETCITCVSTEGAGTTCTSSYRGSYCYNTYCA